ncbi:EH signature domain-containing protein [Acinetobacter baumannii]|uniref:EH signature domain-containing protein n=1 Tax=Acinetobacter baumannii TaxID=470 RepID=UPI0038926FF0
MTIVDLKQRLQEKISQISEPNLIHNKFVRPQRLMKTLTVIEKKFDDSENTQPLDEKIFKTITRLKKNGFGDLTRRDLKNLAWALGKKLPSENEKMLFTQLGKEIINYFSKANFDLLRLVYFPLLYTYFSFEKKEVDKNPSTWVLLRNILSQNKSKLFRDLRRPKPWMTTLVDHAEILSDQPTKKFVRDFLQDNEQNRISAELESLRISASSWFWDDLIRSSIKSIKHMKEDEYFKIIPRFLLLLEKNKLYTTDILVALLERYANSSDRAKVHEELKNIALDQWGNPQYESSAGWNNVNTDTKKMVIQWFVRADLEAFFRLFSRTADVDRFNYWIKFIDKISVSQIFLGPAATKSTQAEHRKFREINRGRLKRLSGSTQTNNAFMLKIENIYVFDFSDIGNACYILNKIPYNQGRAEVHIDTLKPWEHILKLSHTSGWQRKFDEKLAELGIFANRNINSRYGR